MRKLFVLVGSSLVLVWGIAHLYPTHAVITWFGAVPSDDIRIVRMEWINEGLTLLFAGVLNILITVVDSNTIRAKRIVYFMTFVLLLAMSIVSLFTGFRVDYLPFKLCPFVFIAAGVLILQGAIGRRTR